MLSYIPELLWVVAKIGILFFIIITGAAYYTLMERKWAGYFQDRYGPNRAGFWGILQPLADGIKFLTKQETIPRNVDTILFVLAPALSLITAILLWATIPFTPVLPLPFMILGHTEIAFQVTNINTGILFIFAISSLSVYGILLAGWSSNNKYSFLGAVRASAQMISYELSLSFSVIGVILMTGHLDLYNIILAQKDGWFLLTVPGAMGFIIFLICVFAETNRLPFDLAEAESELVVGFHTEYGAFKFALFFIAEYMNMITFSFLICVLFLGGWNVPKLAYFFLPPTSLLLPLIGVAFFIFKTIFFIFFFVWVRWSLPRFRYDQLMNLGWKNLLPLSLLQVCLAGIYTWLK